MNDDQILVDSTSNGFYIKRRISTDEEVKLNDNVLEIDLTLDSSDSEVEDEFSNIETTSKTNYKRKRGRKKQVYICTLCNKELKGMIMYNYHMKRIHRDILFTKLKTEKRDNLQRPDSTLLITKRKTKKRDNLQRSDSTLLKCPVCKAAVRRFNLDLHLKKSHQTNLDKLSPFTCWKCERLFTRFANLLNHEKITHGESQYLNQEKQEVDKNVGQQSRLCSKCNRTFSSSAWLIRHEKKCLGGNNSTLKTVNRNLKNGSIKCSYCPASFTLNGNRNKHEIKFHSNQTVFNPNVKNNRRKFQQKTSSRKPKATNMLNVRKPLSILKSSKESTQPTNLSNFSAESYTPGGVKIVYADDLFCDYCPKRFSLMHHKKLHEKIHTGDRPYQCTNCNASFRIQRTLNNHEKRCADLIDVNWCNFCDYQNKCRNTLRTHCQSMHGFDLDTYETRLRETSGNSKSTEDILRRESDVIETPEEKVKIKVEEKTHTDVCVEEESDDWSLSIIIDDDDKD